MKNENMVGLKTRNWRVVKRFIAFTNRFTDLCTFPESRLGVIRAIAVGDASTQPGRAPFLAIFERKFKLNTYDMLTSRLVLCLRVPGQCSSTVVSLSYF